MKLHDKQTKWGTLHSNVVHKCE